MKHLVCGLGSIGMRHAKMLQTRGHDIAGFDPVVSSGLDFPVYTSMESAFQFEPDMAWICSPTQFHAEQAIEALKEGFHVFVEKPVAHTIEAACRIKEEWSKAAEKKLFWVACNMRFHPAVIKLKRAVNDGIIGRPLIFRFHFSHYLPNMRPDKDYRKIYAAKMKLGGGIVFDDIHDIDLALWFSGPVKKVAGLTSHSGALDIEAEDIGHISILHNNGVFSEIHMDFLRRDKSRGIEVIGEKGTLEWRSLGKRPEQAVLQLISGSDNKRRIFWQETIENFDEMFAGQFDAVLGTIGVTESYRVSLDEGLDALKIALEVKRSD